MMATIICPSFEVTPDALNFGPIFIGQEAILLLHLTNLAPSSVKWQARIKSRS